jgi:hypothetical protein
MIREAPAAFVKRLHDNFPDFIDLRWNLAVSRWEFIFTSTANRPISTFYGWDRNPLTNKPLEPDVTTGLPPFRDLDINAQNEIIETGHKTYLGNRVDGSRDWKHQFAKVHQYNDAKRKKSAATRASDFVDLLADVAKTASRPGWLKEHGKDGQRLREKRTKIEALS